MNRSSSARLGLIRHWRGALTLVSLVFAVAVVPQLSAFYVGAAGQMAVYAIAAMGSSLLIQHCNLPSIGQAVFFGMSAYAVGLLLVHGVTSTIPAIVLAVLITMTFALLAGPIVLRTRAAYFMMITLAIGQLVSGLSSSLTSFTGGANGLAGLPPASIFGLNLANTTTSYYVFLVVLVVIAALMKLLVDAPYGFALRALKGDDRRPRSLGMSPLRVKLVAWVLAAGVTGLAGALYALNVGYVDPSLMSASSSGSIFLMVALTMRLGTFGPIAGAVVVEGILTIVASHTSHDQFVLGAVSIVAALLVVRPHSSQPRERRPWLQRAPWNRSSEAPRVAVAERGGDDR